MRINLFHHVDLRHIEATTMKNGWRLALVAAGLLVLLACAGCGGGGTEIGETGVTITDVVITDRFPPDCEAGEVWCTLAGEGSQYLVIWLESEDGGDAMAALGTPIYVTDNSGSRYNLGGGLSSARYFAAQKVPASASGFTLHVSGVEPIDLGK